MTSFVGIAAGLTHRLLRWSLPRVGVVLFALLVGCSEKRWTCEACLNDDPKMCASSNAMGPTPHRDEEQARCSAGEELCSALVGNPLFKRYCMGKAATVNLGCSKEFLTQLRFKCGAKTHLHVPLLIDL